MEMFHLVVLILPMLSIQVLNAHVIHDDLNDEIVAQISGSFLAMENPQQTISRRDLDAMNKEFKAMRLDLGSEMEALEMELHQDSAWTDQSIVVVKRGDLAEEVKDAVDASCFLSGSLTSHQGFATLNRCGRMTGMIQTNTHVYELEEDSESDSLDSHFAKVKVTVRRSDDNVTNEDDGIIIDDHLLGHEDMDESDDVTEGNDVTQTEGEEDVNEHERRQRRGMSAEVAIYLDENFTKYMMKRRGKNSMKSLSTWLVMKWNVIRKVMSNARKIGAPLTLELKLIEVWERNPVFYRKINRRADTVDFLRTFCHKIPKKPDYDHKMLYTKNTGQSLHLGMAYFNGICRVDQDCSLVKSYKDPVKIELHEFGHSIGLDHDPDMSPCRDPTGDGGFMGWGSNYDILDCYKREFLKYSKQSGARCLRKKNVNKPVLNTSKEKQH